MRWLSDGRHQKRFIICWLCGKLENEAHTRSACERDRKHAFRFWRMSFAGKLYQALKTGGLI